MPYEGALEPHGLVGVPQPVRWARVADNHVGERDPLLRVGRIGHLLALGGRVAVAARTEGADVGARVAGRVGQGDSGYDSEARSRGENGGDCQRLHLGYRLLWLVPER